VMLEGRDLYDRGMRPTDVRKRVGMVFQKPNPFPTMTVAENVISGLRLCGVRSSRHETRETVERCLRQAGLWNEMKSRLGEPGGSLSGGQQQRLCIARALGNRPDVLLMDEPASALDPLATQKIEELIFELKRDYTIVIVTHNMQQAARVSDLTAFLEAGRLVEFGETQRLFTAPANERTEAYITGRFG